MSRLSPLVGILVVGILAIPTSLWSQARPQSVSAPAQNPAPAKGAASDADPDRPQLHERNPRYRLESGDILELAFRYTPEFDQEVTVQPDGYVQLKGLQKAYSNTLHDPVISVVLREFEKPYFIAGGQVSKPGKYDLRGRTTATQAVAIAGGFSEYSKNSQVLLFRRYNDDLMEVKVLNLNKVLKDKNYQEDLQLQPGDMLYVPKTFMAKIDRFLPRSSLGTYFSPALL